MKRSEVIAIIYSAIVEDQEHNKYMHTANALLDDLEDAGLIYPEHFVKSNDGMSIKKNGWEPEDV
jgi:hypothetical protein